MNPSRIFVLLLLLVGLAAGGYWLFTNSTATTVKPTTPNVVSEQPPVVDQPPPEAVNTQASVPQPENRVVAMTDNTNSDAAQGVKGRLLLPNGSPAAEVPIYLIESMMNDPIRVFLLSKSGRTTPPVSSGMTAMDGTFALGAREPGKSYDLRVASVGHPELQHPSIKVRDEDWYDTGDLSLEKGIMVSGRVIDEITQDGVPEALVYLADSNQAHVVLPTPGRERGILAVTDNGGNFRFANAPTQGVVNLTAEAPGYATGRLSNLPMAGGKNTGDLLIEISRGLPIAGVVVDSLGEPISNVKVTAQGLSQKTPQTESTTTGRDGTFQFPSLREGPYTLAANSAAYAEAITPPVITGDLAVKLVVIQRPWVKLRVTGADGRPIKAYRVSLKRHFPNNPLGIGNVPEFRDRSITPADYGQFGDWAVIRGLPAGDFVFQIQERRHAKSLSAPFKVTEGGPPAQVQATLTLGAAITGTVVDNAGKPVRGAVVSTDMNNAFQGDGGIFDLFRSMIPERHSKAQARTDGKGRFRMDKLAFADYMVRVSHPDFCEGTALNITLATEGQVADVGIVRLTRGTIVEGFTTIGGQAVGQIKVSLSIPPPENPTKNTPNTESQSPQQLFAASAISDSNGVFRLLKRVPPGTYKVTASRATQNDPFSVLLDMRETERTVTLQPGQDRLKIDFDLPAR